MSLKAEEFWLVIDYESICDETEEGVKVAYDPQEILEFPALLIRKRDMEPLSWFHMFIKPSFSTIIPRFCTLLTGITQDQVDNQETFPSVLNQFETWCQTWKIGRWNSTVVTFGAWDLKALSKCCLAFKLNIPDVLNVGATKEYLNIRKANTRVTRKYIY